MTPQLLVGAGLVALAAGGGILLSFGHRYRVGRLLATAPLVTIGEAVGLARAGDHRFVRIEGRIDSEEEFEGADHQPLVLRRTRYEHRPGSLARWHTLEVHDEAAPFELHEGLDAIAIDRAALRDGLVVVPRRSLGRISDLGPTAPLPPGSTPSGGARPPRPDDPARMTIEQISSVEHATAAGVPVLAASGAPTLTAGHGRPLLLTTLEIPEAMRVLTGGAVTRARFAAGLLAIGLGLLAIGLVWWIVGPIVAPASVQAASPIPSVLPGSDTRSSGSGPGLVGNPALAILGVAGIAIIAIVATLAYVRLTASRRDS